VLLLVRGMSGYGMFCLRPNRHCTKHLAKRINIIAGPANT
jgi:hypothetical protein